MLPCLLLTRLFCIQPSQLAQEKRRVAELESQVEASRAQLLAVVGDHTGWLIYWSMCTYTLSLHTHTQQNQVEQEEELITNTLLKRLEQLRREKQDLSKEVERQESYLLNTLQKRLDQLAVDKGTLERQLTTLNNEKHELRERLARSFAERAELENVLEAEEEKIVNTLQRQIEGLTTNLKIAESKLESLGVHVRDLGMLPLDNTIDWVYGRSPSRTLSERSSLHADSGVSRQSSIASRGGVRRVSLDMQRSTGGKVFAGSGGAGAQSPPRHVAAVATP